MNIRQYIKRYTPVTALAVLALLVTSCNSSQDQAIIYTNADDEAIQCMEQALNEGGFEGQYMFQSLSTSELGGKILVEGKNIEADLITISSYYIDSAEEKNNMFVPLKMPIQPINPVPNYMAPITSQEGTIFYNTHLIKENKLPVPTSIKDLANPIYKGHISIANIKSSSTAWLLVQALVDNYGEDEARQILKAIVSNAGPHFESSGSAPLKKVRAGEVAIGFGLRQQAVLDKKNGLPIDYADPSEGSYTLQEAICIPNHGTKTNPKAHAMATAIIRYGRTHLRDHYPVILYQGEQELADQQSNNIKIFPLPLTVELLKQHEKLMTGE